MMLDIPQPPTRPLVGNLLDLDPVKPTQSLLKLSAEYGPIYKLDLPGQSMIVISSHELVRDACDESRFEKHIHGPLKQIRDFAGDGLFTAYGDEPNWAKAHRILMPAFGPAALRGYFPEMLEIADQMLTKWERLGPEASIDVVDNMTRLTLDTIALCGFGYRFNSFYQSEMHPFVDAMVRALIEAGNRGRRPALQNQLMFVTRRQYESDAELMHRVCDELVAKRRKSDPATAPKDMLNLMLTAADPETGERLDDANIRNQLVTFLIAGHETTSGLLSFTTYLLLNHPEVMAKARQVADEVLGDGMPGFEQMAKLGYLDQILRESLRLYPTAPAFAVHATEDTTLGGRYGVWKDQVILISIPGLHRDAAVWPDPERFDPDRWSAENRDSIPDKAWLPFGNGMRSCIGRAFALQEAALVLAMMVQRFDIAEAEPYTLDIHEALTIKPYGLHVHATPRKTINRTGTATAAPEQAGQLGGEAAGHGTPLLLLYGSNSGTSESFARKIASDGMARGWAANVAPMDQYVGRLPAEGAVVVICASYNGEPPDNARAFVTWLGQGPSLDGVRFAVFGCGSRDWPSTYQAVPELIDRKLAEAGAERLADRGEADAAGDLFGDFDRWYAPFWDYAAEQLGVEAGQAATGPLYDVEVIPSPSADMVEENKLGFATITANRELVDMTSPLGRSKRHVEFALPEGMTYETGDYLAVLPENHPDVVERAAAHFGLRPDSAVILNSTRGPMAASLPTGQPISVQELFGRQVELTVAATAKDVALLASLAADPGEKQALGELAGDQYTSEILDKRVSVLDLLDLYPSVELTLAGFLELLPAMKVRQYSISSSPRWSPGSCTLTVGVVDAPAMSGVGQFRGVCSTYLARQEPGDQVAAAVRKPNHTFQPPEDNAAPMVMVCAGTGLAPFRGFCQERSIRQANGEQAGPALLFFGCDDPDVDFLYLDELRKWESEGVVRVLPAFTFKPEGDVKFVQHRIWQERDQVKQLVEQGATVYLCGDGRRMAPAVKETLLGIYQEATGQTPEQAAAWWAAEVEPNGRYVADVFS